MYQALDDMRTQTELQILEFTDRYVKPLEGGYRDLQLIVICKDFRCEVT